MIYPDPELNKKIREEAEKQNRTMSNYIVTVLKDKLQTKNSDNEDQEACGVLFERDSFRFKCGEDYSNVPLRNFGVELCPECAKD